MLLNFGAPALLLFYLLLAGTIASFAALSLHRLFLVSVRLRYQGAPSVPTGLPPDADLPYVTVQLPIYNEYYVAERLIESAGRLDYPSDKFEIQVLDDSTDETSEIIADVARKLNAGGIRVEHLQRGNRGGYKAGALAYGLERARGELVAVFDADFIIPAEFLRKSVGYFSGSSNQDGRIAMVQARWGFLNENDSLLTEAQALLLRAHFRIEHFARFMSGRFFNFNGTAGIWRADAIRDSGGWQGDTLTEDLDLSYRAQLAGWRFLYLDDVECPSELPPTFKAFKTQQHRWLKGMTQVAVKLLPKILGSDIPFRIKAEAAAHLLAPITYVVTLISFLLLLPILAVSSDTTSQSLQLVYAGVLGWTTLVVMGFHYIADRASGTSGGFFSFVRRFVALLALCVGNSLNAVRAIFEGVAGNATPFIRTPKHGGECEVNLRFRYQEAIDPVVLGECLMAVYGAVTFVVAVVCCFAITPWALLFAVGSAAAALSQIRETVRGY